jgi:hypothetical protein
VSEPWEMAVGFLLGVGFGYMVMRVVRAAIETWLRLTAIWDRQRR